MNANETKLSNIDFARISETQIHNLLRYIRNSINHIKIALIIPQLGADMARTKARLEGTPYQGAIAMLEKVQNLQFGVNQVIDSEILGILLFFQKTTAFATMFPRLMNNLSNEDKTLLAALQTLYDVTEFHLNRTARSELDVERELHFLFHKLEETKVKTIESKVKLRKRRALLRWRQAIQFAFLGKLHKDLKTIQTLNDEALQKEITKIDRSIRDYQVNSVLKYKEVEEELQKARAINERHNANIAGHEKAARADKNKLLIQLSVLTTKFDSTLHEKMRENLELGDRYREAKRRLDAFMIIYRKEEAIYKKIVVEYETELARKREVARVTFQMNLAARKIQRYWAKWHEIQLRKERRAERLAEKKAKTKKK